MTEIMTRSFAIINLLLPLSLLMIMTSCGEEYRKARIRELEKQFRTATVSKEKSELANLLHKEYNLYHLDHKNDTSFLLNWANMALEGKEFNQAKWIYDQYIDIEKTNPYIFEQRGRLNTLLGHFNAAGQDFEMAASLTNNPTEKDRLLQLALSWKNSDSVIHAAEKKIRDGQDVERNLLIRASELIENKQLAAARYDIEAVMQLNQENSSAYYLMAKLRHLAGDLEEAGEMIERYKEMDPSGNMFLSEAKELETIIQEKTELSSLQEKYKNNVLTYEELIKAGTLSFKLKEYVSANEYFNKLITQHPDSTLGYLYRGQVHLQTGKLDLAMKDFKVVLSKKPSNISARNLKAYIHLLRKELDELKQEVDHIRSLNGVPLEILEKSLEENK